MKKSPLAIVLASVIFILTLNFIFASVTTTFSDGASTKNLEFSGNESLYAYIKLPVQSAIASAVISLQDITNPWIYQENSNGSYGKMGGEDDAITGYRWAHIYSNYSKIERSILGTKWALIHAHHSSPVLENITLPESCFDQDPNSGGLLKS